MAKSLQDQLLNAGLANKKQAVKARKAKNTKEKLKRSGVEVVDEAASSAQAAVEQQVARDKALNKQKKADDEQKAIKAQIRQICSLNKIEQRGDTEFRFTDGDTVKTLMLQNGDRQALIRGALAIVKFDNEYTIITKQAASKIAERDPASVVLKNESVNDESDSDDEYAEFKVPDDLMW